MPIRIYLSVRVLKCLVHSFVTLHAQLPSEKATEGAGLGSAGQNWREKVRSRVFASERTALAVVKRIQFKILLLCYRRLNDSARRYLTSLLSPSCHLRSDRKFSETSCSMFQTTLG